MLLAQPTQSVHMKDDDMVEFYRHARRVSRERRPSKPIDPKPHSNDSKTYLWPFSATLNRTPIRRKSNVRSGCSTNISTTQPLRLADVAKQHVMGTHVDNWREDMVPMRQHLPLQHIIGSLKRDRDEPWTQPSLPTESSPSTSNEGDIYQMTDLDSSSHESGPDTPMSTADSFLELLQTPKSLPFTPEPDHDRRFSYQAPDHVAKDIPQSALPGLNMAINLATITAEERNLFSEYAPKELDDPHTLMDEVRRLREFMMSKDGVEVSTEEKDDMQEDGDVTKDFDTFVDYE